MARHKLDPNRPYTPPENEAEYKKQLRDATRNYLGLLNRWAGKLGKTEERMIVVARLASENLLKGIDQL